MLKFLGGGATFIQGGTSIPESRVYGREAVRYKLKNGLKTQKKHFLAVIELISDSLTAIMIKPH